MNRYHWTTVGDERNNQKKMTQNNKTKMWTIKRWDKIKNPNKLKKDEKNKKRRNAGNK